jgi:hypothetical protein
VEEGKGQRAQDGAYPLEAVAKTGQLRIPVFPCRLGNFEKIDLGTDFEKTALNTSAFQGVELGIPHSTFLFGKALIFPTGVPLARLVSGEALCGRSECFDNPTVGDGVAATGIYQRVEFTSKRGKVRDLSSDRVAVLVGNDIHCDAGLIAPIRKTHQLSHLIDRETKIARTPNEGQAAQMRPFIGPIVPRRSCGCRQQANLLIVADRFDLRTGRTGQFSDRQFLRHSA